MYDNTAIEILKGNIGFGDKINSSATVSDTHKTGSTGRLFSAFHKLVTIDNLYATVPKIDMIEADFNAFLLQLKTDAVKSALVKILNQNTKYQDDFDYSDTIVNKSSIFDEVVGYTLAIQAIELMVSTTRDNSDERNAILSYQLLKIELEGITDDKGFVKASGINQKLKTAIRKAQLVIFPTSIPINNASNKW